MVSSVRPPHGAFKSNGTFLPVLFALIALFSFFNTARCMTDDTIRSLRQETKALFYHGYDSYMKYAFPEDELRPLSCRPLTRDRENPAHIEVNDVLGNYSLTLIDSLSTLAILASSPPSTTGPNRALDDFQNGIALLVEHYGDGTEGPSGQGKRARGFDLDSKVQVFETVIRGLGGLLSAHLFAVGDLPIRNYEPITHVRNGREEIDWPNGFVYSGQLLRLALDLGKRLLPAFTTPTGLPYPRVNLRHGIPFYANSPLNMDAETGQCQTTQTGAPEITETCSAGAASLVLEMTTLSRLTGDERFEKASKRAFWAVWQRRSSAGLVGAGIDSETGLWVSPYTGIGAGIDSFFEYAFKSHVLLSGLPVNQTESQEDDPDAFLDVWNQAHAAVRHHIYRGAEYQHPHYIQVDLYTGATRAFWIDSLSAFYPGLLALAGELEEAIETQLIYTALWTRYSALPERWSTASGSVEGGLGWWGGRPEFIESTWYIYRATQDPWYLHVGEMALRDIKRRCWTRCGWAGIQDVRNGEKSDRMESFFLGETAKYLFLLFDPSHPLNNLDAPIVFTTEGHPLMIPKRLRSAADSRFRDSAKPSSPYVQPGKCPLPPSTPLFSMSATAARPDIFHAASLTRLHLMPTIETVESPMVEFEVDHPSITMSDLRSPTNYTFYPWTLPQDLIPYNGMSSVMASRSTFDLSFPTLPNTVLNSGALQRVNNGILVKSMSGLRLGMIRELARPDTGVMSADGELFRVQGVSHVALGRDEKVFVTRDLLNAFDPVDPQFTRTKDLQMADILIDIPQEAANRSSQSILDEMAQSQEIPVDDTVQALLNDLKQSSDHSSIFDSILQHVTSILMDPPNDVTAPTLIRETAAAVIPVGIGAAPLPDVDDFTLTEVGSLEWHDIYVTDTLCNHKLPSQVARENQVIVIQRGDCSFSQKLANLPSFVPSRSSLKLVIIVSFPEHDQVDGGEVGHLIRPLLDEVQVTPAGMQRPHPIPMVMVGGGKRTYQLLESAQGLALRRRYHFVSQGLPIGNLIVL